MENKDEKIPVNEEVEEVLTFTDRDGHYDVTLIVEGRRIPVVKSVLSVASPVFKTLFEGDFKEKDQKEVKLAEKNYEDFVEFLSCLYPNKLKGVTKDNVYGILPLVHYYQVVDVLHENCDKLIYEILRAEHVGDPSEIYRHLQLSNTYNLHKVREKCIYLASELTTEQMAEGSSIYKPTKEESSKILLLALKRHELDAKDIQDVVNKSYYSSGSVHCSKFVSDKIDRASTLTTTSALLQALRLCYKYPENKSKKDTVFLNLYILARRRLQEDPEFDLLPERAKQAWEKYCLAMS